MSSVSPLRVSFVGKDFDTHFNEILQEVQTNFGATANDFTTSNLGTMFIDLVAFGLDTLSFYADLQANEAFLPTAILEDSVVKIARQLGFKVTGGVPASTDLDFAIATALAFDVPISKGFQFTGGNLLWETRSSIVLLAGQTTITFSVSEGETVEERFISDGTKNQVFLLGQVPLTKVISDGTEEVFVSNEPFTVVEFLEFRPDKIVEVQPRTSPPQVIFGDDVAGQIPPNGAEIRVRYFASSGELGNEVASGAINTAVAPLVVNGQAITFTVTNPNKATGGSAGKTIEEVKRLAPEVFRSQDAAVTARDIVALSESFSDPSFGAVEKAAAISVRDASQDAVLEGLLQDIQDIIDANQYTSEFATLTTIKDTFAGTERDDVLKATDKIEENTNLTKTDFDTALAFESTLLDSFNEILREANFNIGNQLNVINTIARTVLATSKNDPVQFRLATGTAASGETFTGTLPIPAGSRIVPGSVSVRLNGNGTPGSGTVEGTDQGDGTITGANITASTIDYFSGAISITESGDPWGAGATVDVDLQTFKSDEADVLSATGAILTTVTNAQSNIATDVSSAEDTTTELFTLLQAMKDRDVTEILAEVEKIRTSMNALSTTFQDDFDTALTTIQTGVATTNTGLATSKTDIFDHVDLILSDDCKANVVQVGKIPGTPIAWASASNVRRRAPSK